MLQKLLWRKGKICSTSSAVPGATQTGEERGAPSPARNHGCSHQPFQQLRFPPSAPTLLILEGYINTHSSALLDGGLPA